MQATAELILKPGKERSVLNRHPWLFSGAIGKVEGKPVSGDVVHIKDSTGKWLGAGHYNEGTITARIFSFERHDYNYNFWLGKIKAALDHRKRIGLYGNASTNCFRLFHGEGDEMPALIIDWYDGHAVIQAHSAGMWNLREWITEGLKEIFPELKTVYDKSADTIGRQTQLQVQNTWLYGNATGTVVKENEIKLHVNWQEGQKTGLFLDQRENRKLLSRYCSGKNVLNAFAYSGGFSVFAAAGGAKEVTSVESSVKALKWAQENVSINFPELKHNAVEQDVFSFLKSTDGNFDVIVLDPPAFAKHIGALAQAQTGYRNINEMALRKVNRGGIIFTFSCSQAVNSELFQKIIFKAAIRSGRKIKILHKLTQAPDHPVNVFHPEGEYLKGFALYVE